jgi:hypothetical protein
VFQVSRIAVAPAAGGEQSIFVASIAAPTAMLDARGKETGRWPTESGGLSVLAISRSGNASNESRAMLGIVLAGPNQFVVVGFAANGSPVWQIPLPPGVPSTQIEPVVWGRVVGDAEHWTIAAPDGSIHFLAADGKPLDYFALGALPTGVAIAEVEGKPALIVCTKNGGVEALRFELAEAIEPAK